MNKDTITVDQQELGRVLLTRIVATCMEESKGDADTFLFLLASRGFPLFELVQCLATLAIIKYKSTDSNIIIRAVEALDGINDGIDKGLVEREKYEQR